MNVTFGEKMVNDGGWTGYVTAYPAILTLGTFPFIDNGNEAFVDISVKLNKNNQAENYYFSDGFIGVFSLFTAWHFYTPGREIVLNNSSNEFIETVLNDGMLEEYRYLKND